VTWLLKIINQGQERSVKIKKNILEGFLIKGGSILVSLILVPLTIHYVNPTRYGIWLTISSVVGWLSFFDIGLTQGLRNKFAEAKAQGDDERAQVYVSTTYALLGCIFLLVWAVFMGANQFLDWSKILGIPAAMQSEITMLVRIVFTYFCLQFVFRIISTILIADQNPSRAAFVDFLGQLLALSLVFVLTKTVQGSLLGLGLALCVAPLLVLLCTNIVMFRGRYKKYRPSWAKVDFRHSKDLLSLGLVFFVIQIAFIIQYQTASIIIARNFGPLEVAAYSIVYKYFSVIEMVSIIFVMPFWSASTEAYMRGDIPWIKSSIKYYNVLNLLLFFVSMLMLFFSGAIYDFWLGKDKLDITFELSIWGFVYFNVAVFSGKYVEFLNGISALRLQFIASLISPFIYVGVSILLIQYFHLGVHAVFIAAVVANFNGFLLAPLQYHQIIERNKRGIWAK
jgi:O-antigen/teichoic acid export membrane protein